MKSSRAGEFLAGLKDGLPIGLGYLAVSFTLGIQCREAGLNALEAAGMSFFNFTSAGEFAGLATIKASASYLEMALSQFIINLRYMLMSFALAQKAEPTLSASHRMGVAYGVTDEIFAITVGREGRLSPYYAYGAMATGLPGWTLGTMFGVILGNVLPDSIVNALGLALYAMFLAIIVPVAKEDKHVALACLMAVAVSCAFTYLPALKNISAGSRIIIATLIVSLLAAILWPREEEEAEHA